MLLPQFDERQWSTLRNGCEGISISCSIVSNKFLKLDDHKEEKYEENKHCNMFKWFTLQCPETLCQRYSSEESNLGKGEYSSGL